MSDRTCFAIKWAAPLCACRTTNISAFIAERLLTVSSRASPLDCAETAIFRLMTSADKRLAAISNVVRVRVLDSKKRLNIDFPRNNGIFLTSRSVTPTNDSAVSSICSKIEAGNPSVVSKCCSTPFSSSCGFLLIMLEDSCHTNLNLTFHFLHASVPAFYPLVVQVLHPYIGQQSAIPCRL